MQQMQQMRPGGAQATHFGASTTARHTAARRQPACCFDSISQHQVSVAAAAAVLPELANPLAHLPATATAPHTGRSLAETDPDAVNPAYNRSGLNGLTRGATSGLDTVSREGKCAAAAGEDGTQHPEVHSFCCLQGCFTVTSQMPVQYTVTEVHGILDIHNKVCGVGSSSSSITDQTQPPPSCSSRQCTAWQTLETLRRLRPCAAMPCAGPAAGCGPWVVPLRPGP
jgi:hypothetical protein